LIFSVMKSMLASGERIAVTFTRIVARPEPALPLHPQRRIEDVLLIAITAGADLPEHAGWRGGLQKLTE
jgi:hypothetical protein